MKIGTYYYPEQWPRKQWRRDFDNMRSMGLRIVHMAEFAWLMLEPSPGKFEFDWLVECVELARERQMDVILCTPTASPPIWLVDQYPDVLPVDENGARSRFGGRRHYTPTSIAMLDATTRIVTAMADQFGTDASVIGWQIDNEMSGAFDQSEQTHAAFREWLRAKYLDIATLNEAWGTSFWSTSYARFEQILMPARRDPSYANPHQHLDASRFWSDAYATFALTQAKILRARIGTRFITTNFMPFHLDCDPGAMRESFDVYGWDQYTITGWDKSPKDQTYRIGDPNQLGFVHEQMKSYSGRFALLEVQVGQVNWSGVPAQVYPGAVRLWLWTAWAHGAEFITTYRFRQARVGIEMFHHALIGHDGVTQTAGGREFMQVIRELKLLDDTHDGQRLAPSAAAENCRPVVGILFDHEQLWWYATLPQSTRWNQPAFLQQWYAAAMHCGADVRIVHPAGEWPAGMDVLVIAGVQMVDEALVQRMTEFAKAGGSLVVTCRTALMKRAGQVFEGPTAAPILELIGASVESYDGLPEGAMGFVEMDGVRHAWNVWADQLTARQGTAVLAHYIDQHYAGTPAVTSRAYGQGRVMYCGVYAEQSLCNALIADAMGARSTDLLPDRVHVLQRDEWTICLNFNDHAIDAPVPAGATVIIGTHRVGPCCVALWK